MVVISHLHVNLLMFSIYMAKNAKIYCTLHVERIILPGNQYCYRPTTKISRGIYRFIQINMQIFNLETYWKIVGYALKILTPVLKEFYFIRTFCCH